MKSQQINQLDKLGQILLFIIFFFFFCFKQQIVIPKFEHLLFFTNPNHYLCFSLFLDPEIGNSRTVDLNHKIQQPLTILTKSNPFLSSSISIFRTIASYSAAGFHSQYSTWKVRFLIEKQQLLLVCVLCLNANSLPLVYTIC